MRRLIKSFGYAFSGSAYAFGTQLNFKIHCLALVLVTTLGWYLDLTLQEWLWIAGVSGMVIVAELFNTAIEVLVDLVSPSYNEKAKIVKDVSAAAVLVAALTAVVVGLIIFLPKFC
ncbi:diacylglycerol kinase family protein [Pedobacter sp. GR22-6]|uniref:diacylglycerol kinase family protein n=1 Tax=Pedobacter sp. GR22-6 TaxID=3127957 RepID=UPI00307D89F8